MSHEIDHRLTSIFIAHGDDPEDYIADFIAPRVPADQKFQYQVVSLGSRFQSKKTLMAYGARAQEITSASQLINDELEYHGIDYPVDLAENKDVRNDRGKMYDLHSEAIMTASAVMKIKRETEVRDIVYNTNSYTAGNQTTLGNDDKFNLPNGSDPILLIRNALAMPLAKPNVAVCGLNVFNALASNPHINRAVHGNDGKSGFQDAASVAKVLGLQNIYVGEAYAGTEDINVAPLTKLFDSEDHFALLKVSTPTSIKQHNASAFMVTASDREGRVVRRWYDKARGPLGSEICRPLDQRKVVHLSSVSGYLIKDCLAA